MRSYSKRRLNVAILAGATLLSACGDEPDQNNQAAAPVAPDFISQAPDDTYYDFKAPEPEPEPEPAPEPIVVEQPAPPPPPPAPPPAAIRPSDDVMNAFRNMVIAKQKLMERRQSGPDFREPPKRDAGYNAAAWKTTDEDFSETGAPFLETSLPVDGKGIFTETRPIRLILLDPVLTNIPGNVRFMVAEDKYFKDREAKAFQKGDIVMASYDVLDTGDERVNFCAYRLERGDNVTAYAPDGCFGYLTDQMGRTGMIAEIDTRIYERYREAGLVAGVSTLPAAAAGMFDLDNPALEAGAAQFAQNMGQAMNQALQNSIDLAPIGTVAGGSVGYLRLVNDFDFADYQQITSKEE